MIDCIFGELPAGERDLVEVHFPRGGFGVAKGSTVLAEHVTRDVAFVELQPGADTYALKHDAWIGWFATGSGDQYAYLHVLDADEAADCDAAHNWRPS